MSVDVKKAIEDAEKNLDKKLTDEQRQFMEMFGEIMNYIWSNFLTDEK